MELKENSIELWAQEAEKLIAAAQLKQLTEEQGIFLVKLVVNEQEINASRELREGLEKKKGGAASMLYLRIKYCHTYELDLAAVLLIGDILTSPGNIVMMANYLQYQAYKEKKKRLTLQDINRLFSRGFPDQLLWQKLWNMQKLTKEDLDKINSKGNKSDNLLDYNFCMKSIQGI